MHPTWQTHVLCDIMWQVPVNENEAMAESQAGGPELTTQDRVGLMAHITVAPLCSSSPQVAWVRDESSTPAKALKERKRAQADVPRGAFQAQKTKEQGQQWICPETRNLEWLAGGLSHRLELKGWRDHTVPHTGARPWSPRVPPHKVKGCLVCFQQESVTWARAVVLQVWSAELWGSQRPFQGTCQIKKIWTVLLRCSLPFLLCWRLHWCASQKPRLCYQSEPALSILFAATHSPFKTNPKTFSHRLSLMEPFVIFTKFQPLGTYTSFYCSEQEIGNTHKYFCKQGTMVLLRKITCVIFYNVWAELATLFMQQRFYLSKGRTTRLQNVDIFLEMNKVNVSLKRNNWQYLSLVIKFRLSSENENFGKTWICHCEFDRLPVNT